MLLDHDFDIIKNTNNTAKFVGVRKVVFTSNIIFVKFGTQLLPVAYANLVANDNIMYRVAVVFPGSDIISYSGTYYGVAHMFPVAYNKNGIRLTSGTRLKGYSFELMSTSTQVDESTFYNKKTGNNEITKRYRIYTTAQSLKRISDINVDDYKVVVYDTTVEDTVRVTEEVKNFNGHYNVRFTTGVYSKNNGLYAKADVNGTVMEMNVEQLEMKVIEPSRWAPYYVYRPIINGHGCTIKDHSFGIDVIDTQVKQTYEWNSNTNTTIVTNHYILVIGKIVKTPRS